MKTIIIILSLTLLSCAPKVEFNYHGQSCYTRERCVSRIEITTCDNHYGFNPLTGIEEYHYGLYKESICDKYVTDTIVIKPK